jgi:hypothetical protein
VSSITRLGLKPVFVDVDSSTLNIDISKIEAAVTTRTRALQAPQLGCEFITFEKPASYPIESPIRSLGCLQSDLEMMTFARRVSRLQPFFAC